MSEEYQNSLSKKELEFPSPKAALFPDDDYDLMALRPDYQLSAY